MNVFKYFFNKTKTTIFIVMFSTILLSILIIFTSFHFISHKMLEDYKQHYFSEKAYQMGFIFRSGYQTSGVGKIENFELFNEMAQEFTIPIEFIDKEREQVIYENHLGYQEFEELYTIELPIVKDGETLGFLRSYFDLNKDISSPSINALEKSLEKWLQYITIGVLLLALLIVIVITRRFTRKVDEPALQAVKIMKGNRDITVPKNSTNEINLIIDSVNYLLTEFNHMEKWRKTMMEDLTHELRTPMTSILTRLEAIIDGVYPNSEENLQDIYEELERFSRLVNNVQQLSEAEGAKFKLNIKKVDIIDLVKGVYEGFIFIAKKRKINMHFVNLNVPCNVYIDPDRMIQVVSNLLSNALKYTPAGGHIWIRFHMEEDFFIFYCEDTGVGIEESEQELIFSRFYRIDKSRTRENGGSGIGLSITKALVHAHGGEIGVNSEVGEGAEFWVKIPLDNQLVSIIDESEF